VKRWLLARPLDMRITKRFLGLFAVLATALTPKLATGQAEPRLSDILASADQAWSAGKYDDAFARYNDVLRRDSSSARAVFRVATLLGRRHDLDRSVSLFRLYTRLAPGDADGQIGLARSLAWRGDYDQAIAICDSVVAKNPRQRDAALLAAQAAAWSGRLRSAAARYQHWLAIHADDAEAWMGLARVWQWAGRAEETRQALRHAIAAEPDNADARGQLALARAALAPSFEPTVSTTDDSDDSRSTTYLVRGGLATPWNARVLGDASYRVADLGTRHGTSATLRASSSWSTLDGQWTMHGEAGAVRLNASDAPSAPQQTHFLPVIGARLTGRLTPNLSVGGGVTRAAFDETASLILAGIATTSVDAATDISIGQRFGLSGEGSWASLSGGSEANRRLAGSAALRWSTTGFLTVGAGMRGFAYEHAAFGEYFAPKGYLLGELTARLRLGGELGWGVESELGLGDQTIVAFDNSRAARFAQRASARIAYQPAPGLEWSLRGGFVNAASPTTLGSADYRIYTLAIGGRVRL
jgi:tetratricopeptide (TPR) repeat protein